MSEERPDYTVRTTTADSAQTTVTSPASEPERTEVSRREVVGHIGMEMADQLERHGLAVVRAERLTDLRADLRRLRVLYLVVSEEITDECAIALLGMEGADAPAHCLDAALDEAVLEALAAIGMEGGYGW